jgi:SAM-dependent methyltransferase
MTDRTIFEFARVDDAVDPGHFVSYLDGVGRDLQAVKELPYRALDVSDGDVVLDVGCGPGDDVRRLAALAGARGRVVGIDNSNAMIDEARRRAANSGLSVEFRTGDAHRLELPDGGFDAVRAERVLQHLGDPETALRELTRVTRPGGRIVIGPDPDWETLVLHCSDVELMRRVKAAHCRLVASPGIAHRAPAYVRRIGLASVAITAGTIVLTDLAAADAALALTAAAERAQASGAISSDEASRWLDDLRTRDKAGDFFLALTGFITSARKNTNG